MRAKAKYIFGWTLVAFLAGTFLRPAPAQADPVSEEGELETTVSDDFDHLVYEERHELVTRDGRRYRLEFHGQRPELRGGRRVRVRGDRRGGVISVAYDADPGAVAPVAPSGLAPKAVSASGDKKVAVVLVNFRNDASQPYRVERVRETVFTGPTSVNAYFREQSYGQMGVTGINRADGDIYGWITIDQDNTSCATSVWSNAADVILSSQGVKLSAYDHVVYIFPRTSACPFNGLGLLPGRLSWNNGFSGGVISHELGHNLGLSHANAYSCTAPDGSRASIAADAACASTNYGDPFSVMGHAYRHVHALQKSQLGWIGPVDAKTWTGTDDAFVLAPSSRGTGLRLITVPRLAASGPAQDSNYYLEFRRPTGAFDDFLPEEPVVNGVTIRVGVDSPLFSSQLIDMTPGTTSYADAPLAVGAVFSDPMENLRVTVTGVTDAGATVRLQRLSDVAPPVLSLVTRQTGSVGVATFSWTTNEYADAQVEYGTAPAYGLLSPLMAAMDTAHAVVLTGLAPATRYYYRVRSRDAAGNLSVSSSGPNFISAEAGAPTVYIDVPLPNAAVSGTITMSGRAPDTGGGATVRMEVQAGAWPYADAVRTGYNWTYSLNTRSLPNGPQTLRVRATDGAGNVGVGTVTVNVNNTINPALSNVASTALSTTSAAVSWTTDVPADGQVEYGTSTAYGMVSPLTSPLVTTHTVTLTGLTGSTSYNYRVISRDAAGHRSASVNFTFTTISLRLPLIFFSSLPATLSGTAVLSGTTNGPNLLRVEVLVDGSLHGVAAGTTSWTYSLDTRFLSNATHTVQAVPYNLGGAGRFAQQTRTVSNPTAAFDQSLGAPLCPAGSAFCDSGDLLNGRASIAGGVEPHQPNTLDGCVDGASGVQHLDESIDQLRVYTVDGAPFAPGKVVQVEARAWVTSLRSDALEIYAAADARKPVWTLLQSSSFPWVGAQTLGASFVLPAGGLQAVRARLRYEADRTMACGDGPYDDQDDLVFNVGAAAVAAAARSLTEDAVAGPVAAAYPNPFRPFSQRFMTVAGLAPNGRVDIFSVTGNAVRTLWADASGVALWDGNTDGGAPVVTGVYVVRAEGAAGRRHIRIALLR